jgi:SPP1 family predicted phage head-tail adaptor
MKIGPFRHRVLLEELVVDIADGIVPASSSETDSDSDGATDIDPSADGVRTESWSDAFGYLSAAIEPLSGRDLIAAQAVQSEVTTRIRLRHRPGILSSMRVRHRETIYNIKAVIPDATSGVHWVTLLCGSGVNEG